MHNSMGPALKLVPKVAVVRLGAHLRHNLWCVLKSNHLGEICLWMTRCKVTAEVVGVDVQIHISRAQVTEGAIRNPWKQGVAICIASVSAEPGDGVPHGRLGRSPGVGGPVPVHGRAGVPTVFESFFVDLHEVAVPGEEDGLAMDCGDLLVLVAHLGIQWDILLWTGFDK